MVWIENHTLAYSFRNTWQLLISSITTLFWRKHQPEAKDDSAHWFFKMYHQHSFKKDRFVGLCLQNVSSTRPHHSHSVSPHSKDLSVIISSLKLDVTSTFLLKHCITQYWFRNCSDKQVKVHWKKIKVIMKVSVVRLQGEWRL